MVARANTMKLLAAGCVVGLLSGVSVKAEVETDDLVETGIEDGADTVAAPDVFDDTVDGDEEYEAVDEEEEDSGDEEEEEYEYEAAEEEEEDSGDEAEEEYEVVEEVADDAEEVVEDVPEEEEDVEDAEEEEEEEYEAPEEEMPEEFVAEAPEEVVEEDMVDPAEIEALGFITVQGIDYIPGDDKEIAVADLDNLMVEDAVDCANACVENPDCNLATYFTADPPAGFNCWLKTLEMGCTVPSDTDASENAWLFVTTDKCDLAVAPMAMAPMTDMGMYTQYPGFDYIPADITGEATLVTIMDINPGPDAGFLVDSVEACEDECDMEPSCNAASYYMEPIPGLNKNCFLKILGDACMLPSDAIEDPNAILSLKCDDDALAPLADAPALAPGFAPPPTDVIDTREIDTTTEEGVTEGDADSSPAMLAGLTAVAAAAIAALI